MKHKEYYDDYNEVMYDERDEIKRFLDKLYSITGKSVWHFDSAIEMMASNGAHVKLNAIELDDDCFVVFYVDEPLQKNVKWECTHFAYGELGMVIDALPEVEDLLPDVMDTYNSHNAEKVMLLHVSLNPSSYDLKQISQFNYDEALQFCKDDEVCAMTWTEREVDLSKPNEFTFHADGVIFGDGSDTMFNWIKVL